MSPTSRFAVFARAVLLPLLLSAAVVLGLGSYYETNDDGTLGWLFSGVLALKPVTSVPLYLHGYGHGLAAAYAAAPGVPWLGLLLATLLAAATALWFAVLERLLRPHLRPGWLLLALTLFFGLAWLEHWLWFSHARVAVGLAAGGLLFAAQRPGRRGALLLGLAALLAAWLVRPGLAGLGALAAAPAALYLAGSWRRATPALLGAGLVLALAFGLNALRQTPAEARAQARDARLAQILDYGQLTPAPRTPADSLGTAAISDWLLGDVVMVDAVLGGPVYRFVPADFFGRVVPAKLALRADTLLLDYFPLVLALLVTMVPVLRWPRAGGVGFWLVQLAFAAGLAGLAGLLKLPSRLALPLFDCWLLTNLAFWLRTPGAAGQPGAPAPYWLEQLLRRLGFRPGWLVPIGGRQDLERRILRLGRLSGLGLLAAVAALYAAKTGHRQRVLQHEQRRNQTALWQLRRQSAHTVRVLAGTNDFLKSLSPFRVSSPGPGPVLLLTGWPAHDASQAALRRSLSGTTDQTECLRRLANRPAIGAAVPVVWVLSPGPAAWLRRRTAFDGPALLLRPQRPLVPFGSDSLVRTYRAALRGKKM